MTSFRYAKYDSGLGNLGIDDPNKTSGEDNIPLTQLQGLAVQGLVTPRQATIPYVLSGLTLPSTGALANFIAAGDAEINGIRFIMPSTAIILTASKDNYIDLVYSSTTLVASYLITPVTLAAAAPAIPTNGLRLGFVKTGASTITSATQTGKDSLGNWMRNIFPRAACILNGGSFVAYQSATAMPWASGSLEQYDNNFMHSTSVNNSRVTITLPGLYQITAAVANNAGYNNTKIMLHKNGAELSGGTNVMSGSANVTNVFTSVPVVLIAGDYIQMVLESSAAGCSAAGGYLSVIQM
jgi:hypothetical protein